MKIEDFLMRATKVFGEFHRKLPTTNAPTLDSPHYEVVTKFIALLKQIDNVCRNTVRLCGQGVKQDPAANEFMEMPHIYMENTIAHLNGVIGELADPEAPSDVLDCLDTFLIEGDKVLLLVDEFRKSAH